MSGANIDDLTLTSAMRALRDGSLTAVELLGAVYERYTRTEPTWRSWVEIFEREALAQAVVADRRLRLTESKAPLLGIPVGIKDIFDVAGKHTRCNSELRRDVPVAQRDAEPVHRLRKAGAVLLGKTVTQELAAGVISAPACNPWDPARIPGGSSGGSAAAVAAGTALGALGSDTGGSIRIPASLTGTVGLKPTFGQIDVTGTFPLASSLDTIGPIARTVADAVAMYLVLANRHGEVADTVEQLEATADSPSLRGVRVGVLGSLFTERLQPAVSEALGVAIRQLTELGAEMVACEWRDDAAARAVAMLISRVESAALHHDALRACPECIGEDVRLRLETGALLSGDLYLRARQARQAVTASIAELYRVHRLDALIAPTTAATAPQADAPRVSFPDGIVEEPGPALTRLTMPWNATGQPVVSVPGGFDANGLPIGLSFVGRPHDELGLCRIARTYEQAAGWHRRRPPLPEQD